MVRRSTVFALACLQVGGLARPGPALRPFFQLNRSEPPTPGPALVVDDFRVLQLNMLADGLSGLRADLGAFSRARADDLLWDNRKSQLLHEIVQYKPDLITLQECDHYYDFFLPELSAMGYDGLFAPKPSSACLEVSENSDGCAIFLKRDKFRVTSAEVRSGSCVALGRALAEVCKDHSSPPRSPPSSFFALYTPHTPQTLTFALAKSDVAANRESAKDEDRQVRAQNQVALVALCELVGPAEQQQPCIPTQIIVCTTHLKATKNIVGERTRLLEVNQLLGSVQRLFTAKRTEARSKGGADPLILITGDLNAAPDERSTGFAALAYAAVKESALGLRSVLNDDLDDPESVWTTWKARNKKGKESIAKSCIDYILYRPLEAEASAEGIRTGLRAKAALGLFTEAEIGEGLLPSARYPSDHLAIAADLEVLHQR